MNEEQKQRMTHELGQWNAAMKSSCSVSDLLAISTRMSALLQDLIDAPEPEPVGYTNETELDYVRKYEALPVSGAFWPTSDEDACVALYTAPPANNQSEQPLEMVNPPALSDARILEIAMSDDVSLIEDQGPGVRPRITVHNSIGGVYAFARAIEREILWGGE